MKNVKKILYVLFMTMSFLSFVACSDDSGGGGGGPAITPLDCVTCPTGYGHSLSASAIGKAYTPDYQERLQIALSFYGASQTPFESYPVSSEVAADGIFYANLPITCYPSNGIGAAVQLPQQIFPLQTVDRGVLTQYNSVIGLKLASGALEISMGEVGINQLPLSTYIVDYSGYQHTLSMSSLSAGVVIRYAGLDCGYYGIRGYP